MNAEDIRGQGAIRTPKRKAARSNRAGCATRLSRPGEAAFSDNGRAEGDDVHGQVYPEGKAEQEGSEGTQPPAARDLGLQPGNQDR